MLHMKHIFRINIFTVDSLQLYSISFYSMV